MKKVVGMLLAVLLLAGCGGRAGTGLGGTVNTDGSTSMADVMAALQEAFREKESGVTVNYSGTGSGSGIEAALRGTCDIGLSSRELKEEEKAQGAVGHTVALDGVAVIVNPLNPISDLTVEELALIFTGEISSWSQLGGGAGPIAVYGREAGSGTRGAFEELVGVASNPNAIGYTSLSAVDGTVAALKIGGAVCTEDTVRDGTYPIQRPFLLVTREGAELSGEAQAFLDFALSEAAAPYITKAGAVAP